MEKKDIKKLGLVFAAILLLSIYMDRSKGNLTATGSILRNEAGGNEKEVHLSLDMEGIGKDYEYLLKVEPVRVTGEQAEQYFAGAIGEIEEDFQAIADEIPMKEEYQEGFVTAEWSMDAWKYVAADGKILQEKLPEEGVVVNASVTLTCGAYEQIYQFPFELTKYPLSKEQEILEEIEEWLDKEMSKEGEEEFCLPKEVSGTSLSWSEKRESITLKILVMELLAVFVLAFAKRQKQEQEKKELERKLEFDYPDVVAQLTLLLGAGMNTRQAWNRIATRYSDKRQKEQIAAKPAYEGIARLNRRIQEGENEKIAYQKFANEIQNLSYHHLIRLLVGNMEKGSGGICAVLEQESKQAYEQRILQAKKLGEEASTRMLMPLMLMLVVVMAIIMIPAMVSFAG